MNINIGTRVVGNPGYLPTKKGFYGERRGRIKQIKNTSLIIEFDLLKRERVKKVVELPAIWLVMEKTYDEFLVKNKLSDPYTYKG